MYLSKRNGSVSNAGKTCHNPVIKYGTTEGGFPYAWDSHSHSYDDLKEWCQQLGGTYSSHTKGHRWGPGVIWRTGGDEPGAKWIDFGRKDSGGKWYNGRLYDERGSNYFFISITCN